MFNMLITVYSHHFSVTKLTPKGKQLCSSFASKYVQFGYIPVRGQMIRTALKVFAAASFERDEFRFHINQLSVFKEHAQYNFCNEDTIQYKHEPMYTPAKVDLIMQEKWVARDYQLPIIDYIVKPLPKSKLVGIQTGSGKTATALMAIAKLGQRFVIIVKPMYIDKWIEDIKKTYYVEHEDILVIQGGKHLKALTEQAVEKTVTAKAIIISNKTFQGWMKIYEKFKEESLDLGYSCLPHEIFRELGAGVRLIDEVHQDFHNCFKIDLYTHIPMSISLSATMISQDPFIENMHNLAYPLRDRYKDIGLNKYINSYALHYRFNSPEKIKTSEYGSNNYSHNAVERSIMKHIPTLKHYLNLIDYAMQISYLKCKREKKKMLIFAYSIDFINLLVDFLQRKYPEYDIRRYVAADDYTNLMEADICVSTLGSSGTAVDIPGLVTVILTTTVNSIQSNVQSLGRLRKIEDGTATEFLYLVCDDIPKSVEYHTSKKEMLNKRALTFRDVHTGFVV